MESDQKGTTGRASGPGSSTWTATTTGRALERYEKDAHTEVIATIGSSAGLSAHKGGALDANRRGSRQLTHTKKEKE